MAASLLLYTAAGEVSRHRAWHTAATSGPTVLSVSQGSGPKVLLAPAAGVGPAAPLHYSFLDNLCYRYPANAPAAEEFLATNEVAPTPLDDAKATVQRSWNTVKLAFR